jgi:DNA repair protein RadA/Sms
MGADTNRVSIITAVLEKMQNIHLSNCDIYLNVPGGIRLTEPSADLAITMALVSSFQKTPFPDSVVFGEVGLGGEVRMVPGVIQRIQEAIRMGFKMVVLPEKNVEALNWKGSKRIELIGIKSIEDAITLCHNDFHRF